MISVEIRAPDLTLVPHWDALARRAAANVFLHPAALCAAAAAGFAVMHVLLAWEGETLVGLWALRERRFAVSSDIPGGAALRVRVHREPGDRSEARRTP